MECRVRGETEEASEIKPNYAINTCSKLNDHVGVFIVLF
jgi:hypothetical protein